MRMLRNQMDALCGKLGGSRNYVCEQSGVAAGPCAGDYDVRVCTTTIMPRKAGAVSEVVPR